jgi:hypothetical protein
MGAFGLSAVQQRLERRVRQIFALEYSDDERVCVGLRR